MNAVEKIEKAIAKLEALRGESGPWLIDKSSMPWWVSGLGIAAVNSTWDACIDVADAELIVTLHRTIDAQIAILRLEHGFVAQQGWPASPFPERVAVLALASAILGDPS